ncbi:glutathione peroxidase [Alteromonas lipolytica]|uniref:Glutathione peroxidase n=1 Tax=Alteromonas lipolytica TaxID=1856405 RepID=A0A1E8FEH6_9ALTE|nr:glutathione peroxidase [Alteromonas lipolytica]OFI34334.1 glutathione peroxidase [Alteromonas lipolytica]GGF82380.1 glutathione peroxidase [Alteromonas lipolytica]
MTITRPSFDNIAITTPQGENTEMAHYHDKVLLIVNTASKCGFTPQYEGLETTYQKYKEKGLEILAFPCNQFGQQEPGDDNSIQSFCGINYNITFPVMKKIEVNGSDASPLYKYLKAAAPGLFGTKAIKWNFTKFLISKDRTAIKRYGPQVTPEAIQQDIEAFLAR